LNQELRNAGPRFLFSILSSVLKRCKRWVVAELQLAAAASRPTPLVVGAIRDVNRYLDDNGKETFDSMFCPDNTSKLLTTKINSAVDITRSTDDSSKNCSHLVRAIETLPIQQAGGVYESFNSGMDLFRAQTLVPSRQQSPYNHSAAAEASAAVSQIEANLRADVTDIDPTIQRVIGAKSARLATSRARHSILTTREFDDRGRSLGVSRIMDPGIQLDKEPPLTTHAAGHKLRMMSNDLQSFDEGSPKRARQLPSRSNHSLVPSGRVEHQFPRDGWSSQSHLSQSFDDHSANNAPRLADPGLPSRQS